MSCNCNETTPKTTVVDCALRCLQAKGGVHPLPADRLHKKAVEKALKGSKSVVSKMQKQAKEPISDAEWKDAGLSAPCSEHALCKRIASLSKLLKKLIGFKKADGLGLSNVGANKLERGNKKSSDGYYRRLVADEQLTKGE